MSENNQYIRISYGSLRGQGMTLQAFLQRLRTQGEMLKELGLSPIMQNWLSSPWANPALQSVFNQVMADLDKLENRAQVLIPNLESFAIMLPQTLGLIVLGEAMDEVAMWIQGNWPRLSGRYQGVVIGSLTGIWDTEQVVLQWDNIDCRNPYTGKNYAELKGDHTVEGNTHIWARSLIVFQSILDSKVEYCAAAIS